MNYQEVTDSIVETINLALDPTVTRYQYDFVGIKAINDLTEETFIVEGDKVPDISIETNRNIDWISSVLESIESSPTSLIINILNICTTSIYAKIYLKYNNICTNNYIYIVNQPLADVVLYDKINKNFVFVNAHILNNTDYPLSKYTPIGVEVVPKEHNVYGNGKAGVMSLKSMSYNTPNIGDTSTYKIAFGQYNVSITLINTYNYVPEIINDIDCTFYNIKTNGYTPCDFTIMGNNITCLHDENHKYYTSPYLPSPYLTDGSRNPKYYLNKIELTNNTYTNALSDFDGEGNTLILCNMATALSNWKTDSSIINSSLAGYSPAACCCLRYYTDGTNPGDWYLPTAGELGYYGCRSQLIMNSINKIIEVYNNNYTSTYNIGLSSSTIQNTNYIWNIRYTGNISRNLMYLLTNVCAFIHI